MKRLFATQVEQILWRLARRDLIAAGVLYSLLLVFYMGDERGREWEGGVWRRVLVVIAAGHLGMYVCAGDGVLGCGGVFEREVFERGFV